MIVPAGASPPKHVEIVESLRSRYEAEGFAFTAAPDLSILPSFIGSYLPDALAQKPGRNIAIEVTERDPRAAPMHLQEIRRLFDGHPDWELDVVVARSNPRSIDIATASPIAIRNRLDEVRTLAEQGHRRAAIVMLWSLLEATVQWVEGRPMRRPLAPGTIVQALAMEGLIDDDTELRLRGLIELRDRIVHGDVDAEPAGSDVEFIVAIVDDAMSGKVA